jgi:hypothetical protein
VAPRAALLAEDPLAAPRTVVHRVWIRWRLQRLQIQSHRVDLFIAVARAFIAAEYRSSRAGLGLPVAKRSEARPWHRIRRDLAGALRARQWGGAKI